MRSPVAVGTLVGVRSPVAVGTLVGVGTPGLVEGGSLALGCPLVEGAGTRLAALLKIEHNGRCY